MLELAGLGLTLITLKLIERPKGGGMRRSSSSIDDIDPTEYIKPIDNVDRQGPTH